MGFSDIKGLELITIYPFVILIFVFGLVYQPLLDLTGGPVNNLIETLISK
jgi:NADH:ubiquinone oxidoreductase subunit 4 (subunit M)